MTVATGSTLPEDPQDGGRGYQKHQRTPRFHEAAGVDRLLVQVGREETHDLVVTEFFGPFDQRP
jgi:hypothetical protein